MSWPCTTTVPTSATSESTWPVIGARIGIGGADGWSVRRTVEICCPAVTNVPAGGGAGPALRDIARLRNSVLLMRVRPLRRGHPEGQPGVRVDLGRVAGDRRPGRYEAGGGRGPYGRAGDGPGQSRAGAGVRAGPEREV